MTTETPKNKLILKGRENYLEWSKRFEAMTIVEDWGTFANGRYIPASDGKEKEAKRWVIMNFCDKAIRPNTPSAPLQNLLEKLNEVFGYEYFHPTIQKQSILTFIEFPVAKEGLTLRLGIFGHRFEARLMNLKRLSGFMLT